MHVSETGLPYWRLSSFYLFYFGLLGATVPYWPLFLHAEGLDAREIGMMLAITQVARIAAPNLWGWVADRTGRRLPVVRVGAVLATLVFLGIFLQRGFWWLALVMGLHTFFWNAIIAQFEVVTLGHLQGATHRYSRIRLWGSIGFILAVVGLGALFDLLPVSWLPWCMLGLMLGVCMASFWVSEPVLERHSRQGGGLWQVVRQPPVLAFLAVCMLVQLSHGPYYTFFSLYLEQHGYSRTWIGQLWALGVLAEVIMFLWLPRLLPSVGVRSLLLWTLALSALRWVLIAFFPAQLPVLLAAQCLHALSFGSMHALAIELMRRFFPPEHAGQGQAFYSAWALGLGSALGAMLAGLLWDHSATLTFLLAGGVVLVAWGIAWRWLRVLPPG